MAILIKKQLEFWKTNSYLLIKGLFAEKTKDMIKWVDEVHAWPRNNSKWISFYEMSAPNQLSRTENFVPYHSRLAEILTGETTLGLVSELMGKQALLYKDRINYKYPGGGPHSAHQDGVAYEQFGRKSFDPNETPFISLLISVDSATSQNGCLEIVPNWHYDKLDILPMENPIKSRPEFSKIAQYIEDSLKWLKLPTDSGDALCFTERLPHRSASNFSDKTRKILYGVYSPAEKGDLRTRYFEEKRKNPTSAQYMIGNPHAQI